MKILLIQLRQLGDVLLSVPLARVIKEEIANAEIHFLTSEYALDIVSENPYIDRVLVLKDGLMNEIKTLFKVTNSRYDAILDIQRTGRSKRITLFSNAHRKIAFFKKNDNFYYNRLVKWKNHDYTSWERMELLSGIDIVNYVKHYLPELYFSKDVDEKIANLIKDKNISRFFVVSPTARRPGKAWSYKYFSELSNMIYNKTKFKPFIVYGTTEKEWAIKCFNYIKQGYLHDKVFSIKELAALISHSEFFLGNDSFSAHIAVSQRKKTFVIVGPTFGWYPNMDNIIQIKKDLPCQPCRNEHNCMYNFKCLNGLKPNDVFKMVEQLI